MNKCMLCTKLQCVNQIIIIVIDVGFVFLSVVWRTKANFVLMSHAHWESWRLYSSKQIHWNAASWPRCVDQSFFVVAKIMSIHFLIRIPC